MTWQPRYFALRDQFAAGMDARFYNIEYLDWLLFSGRAAIFFSERSAIVAEIKNYPSGARAVCGVIAVGDKREIKKLIPEAEAWGRTNGCTLGMIESRPAWARELKTEGYAPFQLTIVKDL